jgi:hypothetical protein
MASFFSWHEEDAIFSPASDVNIVRSVVPHSEGIGGQQISIRRMLPSRRYMRAHVYNVQKLMKWISNHELSQYLSKPKNKIDILNLLNLNMSPRKS